MAKISSKNQVTVLDEVRLRAGEKMTIEPTGDGEVRIPRAALSFDDALGALTDVYPPSYLDTLDAEDDER